MNLLDDDESRDFLEGVFGISDTPWEVLKNAFAEVDQASYADVTVGYQAIAGAMIVASVLDGLPLSEDSSDKVMIAVSGISNDMALALVPAAEKALKKIVSEKSELAEVWISDVDRDAFFQEIGVLAMRLRKSSEQ